MSIKDKLNKSPINYFSDLFIIAMVLLWIAITLVMTAMAVFSTIAFQDNGIWPDVGALVAVPLTAGGGIWMIKNSVQHAIAYKQGRRAKMDFPAVEAEGQDDGLEEEYEPRHARSDDYE